VTERKTLTQRFGLVPLILVGGGALVLVLGGLLLHHAMSAVNDVALTSQPKGVTVLQARTASYRPSRRYVGTIEPWVSANIGPQLVSAYVDTVLVRPGDRVKRGQVLATLDCRNSSALSRQIRMQARALSETQAAIAKEAERVGSLMNGGFVSPNEVEQKTADSASHEFEMNATECAIGRAPTCDIVLNDDQMVSRRHAIVRRQGTTVTAVDLGSSNGTLVNGNEIHDVTTLHDGDRLTIGDHDLMFTAAREGARDQ